MRRLLLVLAVTFVFAGCGRHSGAWFAASTSQLADAVHRHHVRTQLRKIREAQARRRVIVTKPVQPLVQSEGRALGIQLAAKTEGGHDVTAERALFRALDGDEQEACLASYSRHGPRTDAGKSVLDALWADRD